MKYQAEVFREGTAWIATVVNANGVHTYSRTLRGLRKEIEEAVRVAEDIPDETAIDLDLNYLNTDEEIREAALLGERRAELDREKQRLLVEGILRAKKLVDRGMPVRDVADLIGVSAGRVSQILSGGTKKTATVTKSGGSVTVVNTNGGLAEKVSNAGGSVTKKSIDDAKRQALKGMVEKGRQR